MLRLQDLTRADMKRFVSRKLFARSGIRFVKASEPHSVREIAIPRIVNNTVQKANYVFLWVVLAFRDVI